MRHVELFLRRVITASNIDQNYLARIFHEHFAHFKVTSVNHMIKLRIIPYFKFAKCSPKASRCD
ncbi:MAG: hypothetical protein U9P36_01150, partial [Thermodesulfobacteriota bacterium]|nr:hypothetical protein [Thermodesulfobacteriota bacterium]